MSRRRAILMAYLRVPAIRVGVLAIALLSVGLLIVWPLRLAPAERAYAEARDRAAGLSRVLAELDARRELAERYLELSAEADLLTARLRSDVDRSTLVERLSAISAAAGTRIIHGSNSFGADREGVTPLLQDLTVEGSYGAVREFLQRVTSMDTLTLLMSVELSANPDGTLVRGRMRFMTLSRPAG